MSGLEDRIAAAQQVKRTRIQYLTLWTLASLSLLVLLIKVYLGFRTAGLEQAAVEKQQFVNQTLTVSRLNSQLVQSLANVAARTGDQAIADLLFAQGIQFSTGVSGGSSR